MNFQNLVKIKTYLKVFDLVISDYLKLIEFYAALVESSAKIILITSKFKKYQQVLEVELGT